MEKEARTIDIGCGFSPVKEATHAIDAFLGDDNQERGKDLVIPEGIVFSQQNIETGTSFDDGYFSYSWCNMVLEHCFDPGKAIDEIVRISDSGYIVVPTWTWEIMHGRPYHKHLFWLDSDGVLCFMEKNDSTYRANRFRGDTLWAFNQEYQNEYTANIDMFEIRMEWSGNIPHRKVAPFHIY